MSVSLLVRDLGEQVAGRQVMVVVGAGVSIAGSGGARAASWTGLLTTAIERCNQLVRGLPVGWGERIGGQIASGDSYELLSAADNVTYRLGGRRSGEYRRWLRETVGQLELRDLAVPEAIARLGSPIVTTNYDDFLEQVTGLDPVTWRDGPRAHLVLRGDERGIVHLHGHWRDPESVVLGIGSYEDVLRDAEAQALLQALATFRSFVLVGFGKGLNDPNFAALRAWMATAHANSEYRHYRLVLDHEVETTAAEHDPCERITPIGYGTRHADLTGFLNGLRSNAPPQRAARAARAPRTSDEADSAAERRYREVALRAFDRIDLANLPVDRHVATRNLMLRRLYVALQVEVEASAGTELEEAHFFALEQRRAGRMLGSVPVRGDGSRRVPVGQRLGVTRRLVVLGDPGAGKTTLLRWMATAYLLRLEQHPDAEALPDADTLPDHDWLPVLIRCRDLHGEATESIDAALRRSLHKLELLPDECDAVLQVLRRRLAAGTALVLVDGLDEIADRALRTSFCQQLERFHDAYPDSPIVVTSRIVGYRELGRRIGRGFEHVTVSELTREDKDDFARRWCALAGLPAQAEAGLIHDLHASPRIEELTGNPMLLTTMVLVRWRIGKLPSRRADLYEEAVRVLLNWRSEVDDPLDDAEALPQLRYLAYAMCDRGAQQLREDEAVELLRELREHYPQLRRVRRREPEDFLRLLEHRTGIVKQSGEVRHDGELVPVYEFRHLTFQEYLAGLALVCAHFPGADRDRSLAQRVEPLAARIAVPEAGEAGVAESWREPLRLCLAACHDADDALLAILTPIAGEDAAAARARAVQAARCLADEPNVTEKVADDILRVFVRTIDATDGSELDETVLHTAARELASSDWGRPLERHLCAEFRRREPAARPSVGRVHQFTSDALRPDDAELADWIREQITQLITQLESPDDIQVIGAALHLGYLAERHPWNRVMRQVPDTGSGLMAALERGGPVSHAAAWALARLAQLFYFTGWRPTTVDLYQLRAYSVASDTDHGALANIIAVLGERRFSAAAPALLELLDHPGLDVRRKAVLALGQLGDQRAADPLVTLLHDADTTLWSDTTFWQKASLALCELGDQRAVEPLLHFLADTETPARQFAARALGQLGDQRAVEPLLHLLADTETPVRQWAALALGQLGDQRAVEPLLHLLADTETPARQWAALALGQLGDQRSVEPLLQLLTDTETQVRQGAAYALGRLGDQRAVEPLLQLLTDIDAQVRERAARALGDLGDQQIVGPLLERFGDPDAKVRSAAARGVGRLGDDRDLEVLLERFARADGLVRSATAEALGEFGSVRAVEPLLARIDDTDADMRAAVAEALGKLGDVRAVESLLERLDDDAADVRAAAAEALGLLGDRRTVEPLLGRLGDVMLDVRLAAAEALGFLGDEQAVPSLLECLRLGNGRLREKAAGALGRIGDPRGLHELRQLLESTARDARRTALEGLSYTCDDETDRKLLTADVDGLQPFLDCNLPIGRLQIRRAARVLELSEQEVQRRYEHLAERFPLELAWPDE